MMEAEYLNVDLELESADDLTPLAEHFVDRMHVLFNDQRGESYLLALEMRATVVAEYPALNDPLDADTCIRGFLSVIAELPTGLRALWKGCHTRVFDLGISAGTFPSMCIQIVSEATVLAIASVGGTLRVTVYPAQLGTNKNV